MSKRAKLEARLLDLRHKLIFLQSSKTRAGTSFKREIAGVKAAIHVIEKQLENE